MLEDNFYTLDYYHKRRAFKTAAVALSLVHYMKGSETSVSQLIAILE